MTDAADKGLATERTALAWQRTALAHLAAGSILLRAVLHDPGWILGFVVVVVFVGVAMAWFAAVTNTPTVRRDASLVVTACTLLVAGASAVVILTAQSN